MKATEVPEIAGAFLFEPTPYVDERGFFCRTFDADVVRSVGLDPDAFVQDSLSRSVRGWCAACTCAPAPARPSWCGARTGGSSTSSWTCGRIRRPTVSGPPLN